MITQVAELAFQCLQEDKELRPSMREILEVLRLIDSKENDVLEAKAVDKLRTSINCNSMPVGNGITQSSVMHI